MRILKISDESDELEESDIIEISDESDELEESERTGRKERK